MFVKHHNEKHNGEYPVWAAVEVLSFGGASKFFKSLNLELKKAICKEYYHAIPPKYVDGWLHSLSVLRNICAHRARLFNRGIPTAILFTQKDFKKLINYGYTADNIGKELFFSMIILDRILSNNEIRHKIRNSFADLTRKYPFVQIKHYGVKDNWKEILSEMNKKYYST